MASPGDRFSYSSFGWALVSAVMESAAQQDFPGYMAAEVFQPLGMSPTRPDRSGVSDTDRTQFYVTARDGKFVGAPIVDSSYMWAGGGFLSTAGDLVRFGSAMLESGFLKENSREMLFTSQKTSLGEPVGYGIG